MKQRISKITAIMAGIVFVSAMHTETSQVMAAQMTEGEVNQYIITADSAAVCAQVEADFAQAVVEEPAAEVLKEENMLLVELTEEQAEQIDSMEAVIVEEDAILTATTEDADYIAAVEGVMQGQWNIHAVNAGNPQIGTDEIRVAILDSGIDRTTGIKVASDISLVAEHGTDDMTGHGTTVANIIASNYNGMCESGIIPAESPVTYHMIQVLDENDQAPVSRVMEGIQWCIDNGIDIINMSFGMDTQSVALHEMVKKAEEAGILMVASAGNNGGQAYSGVQYPAAYPEVIAVASVNEDMGYSAFNAVGSEVELVAPGENVPVTTLWQLKGVGNGSSCAAPHVTAAAALLWSLDASKDAGMIRSLLSDSAKEINGGYRLLDYGCALENYNYFCENYQPGSVGTELVQNNAMAETYDIPGNVQASWGYGNHSALVHETTTIDLHRVKIIQKAQEYVDKNADLKNELVLHARQHTNYVAATRCMYDAAIKWNGNNMEEIKVDIENTYHVTTGSPVDAEGDLKKAFELAVTKNFTDETASCTRERGKLQLLGIAIHIAGDAYAHKVISRYDVSEAYIEKALKNEDVVNNLINSSGNELRDALKSNSKTTASLKEYFKSGKNGEDACNHYFTDCISYMPERYSIATEVATNKLLSYYMNDQSFRPFAFCPMESGKSYSYQLLKLVTNIKDAGYKLEDYYAGKKGNYSKEVWESLSYDD